MNSTCCDDYQGQFAQLGHAVIPKSVVSSIRATGTSTASPPPHMESSTSSIAPAAASQITAFTSASASKSTSSKSTLTSSTSVSIPTSTSRSASAAGLGQSAKIGIVVGVSIGTLLLALSSFIAFRLYRNSQSDSLNLKRAKEAAPELKSLEQRNIDTRPQPHQRYELTGVVPPEEMYTIHNTHEVETRAGASELWATRIDG